MADNKDIYSATIKTVFKSEPDQFKKGFLWNMRKRERPEQSANPRNLIRPFPFADTCLSLQK